ncbi:MoaD/ThiS family protein [Tuwongella immobilis]|uniref:Molybdopterin synthase sulfur carrier subunit n=1 Tax=Tuwongella immobilis TaxID=692036 RepID=A0A6C2YPN8_9BACT|nr:MoaD/ThiS family protein [Tuwongella immobilis]VIP03149.1 Molybdopterin converting factor, subunit 1 OS=Alicyclobacillus hesperidum URH17-3-68 GN=URH17368_0909 PE=4 SV=1: ThiS [Tuwongella immobilis]VTS03534.1 Molybdopterin converting factor, subunit 1 OS=Alicyclobacillus hesperidum URH17-3-68 GN=URH17368_0909 PE=4 SV=1: ThiS [Tuwongella immobilis]
MARLLLFARCRELAGVDSIEIDFPQSVPRSVADIRAEVGSRYPMLREMLPRCILAADHRPMLESDSIEPTSELALIPPVSGG